MKQFVIFSLFVLISFFAEAKDTQFSFEYPDSLAANADAVVLFNHITYTRTSLSGLNEHIHFAITILGERGNSHREFSIAYDPFTTVKKLSCTIYDRRGNKVRKIKNADIRDYSDFSSYTFFHDNRIKYFEANHPDYPYTIEVEYEIDHKGFIGLDTWYPIENYNVGVKEATLKVIFPSQFEIKHKSLREDNIEFIRNNNDDIEVLVWTLKNVMPLEYERFAPPFTQQVPVVYLAPVQFEFDKSKGEFSSWKTMGDWNSGLLCDDFNLSDKTMNDLDAIKAKSVDHTDLVKNVYHYMQSKTRYVGIQLGIGGFTPMSPTLVDKVGYGDCKALSYYTKALLSRVGINSNYTVIGVDRQQIQFDDFVSINQTNHVILCVPGEKDSIWLECTNQNAPFNHLFDGTTNRKALLIGDGTGKIVKTPKAELGCERQYAELSLDENGGLSGNLVSNYSGTSYDDHYGLKTYSAKELNDYIHRTSAISGIEIKSVLVDELELRPELILKREIITSTFSSVSGGRMIFELSPFSQITKVAPQRSHRRNLVYVQSGQIYNDSVALHIPDGFEIEYLPESTVINSKYGTYTMQLRKENQQLVYNRIFSLAKGKYSSDEYDDFIAFINKIAAIDHCKMILKKQ